MIMISRRNFIRLSGQIGFAGATMPLWSSLASTRAFAQESINNYKAIVVISLIGGNDGNNMLIPLDSAEYNEYVSLRPSIALAQTSCIPLSSGSNANFGLHPSLVNVANYYNNKKALFIANVGPLGVPATKAQLLQTPGLIPATLMSHVAGRAQWESATTVNVPSTGWGGRIADFLVSQSGSLPPLLDAGGESIFTVGSSVQGITVQANSGAGLPLPVGINSAILSIAANDAASKNQIVSQVAQVQAAAFKEQEIISQAIASNGPLKTVFPQTQNRFGNVMSTIAQVINGRSVIGASRQIFYCNQGDYDSHGSQLLMQSQGLTELDAGLGAFMSALDEMGLSNQVLICTLSEFNRTMQANSTLGTDHAWGNHQMILGGGITGGRVIGSMPDLELGGSSDLGSQGIWIPTTSVTQMTAGIGSWMGLSSSQLGAAFPDLVNFGNQSVQL
jgi:uncharacterized protein (DUF1501 family)